MGHSGLLFLYNIERSTPGGILSPVLFSIYMDDLSVLLSQSGIGCHIEGKCVNHVFYADNLCLMAPCAIALQN